MRFWLHATPLRAPGPYIPPYDVRQPFLEICVYLRLVYFANGWQIGLICQLLVKYNSHRKQFFVLPTPAAHTEVGIWLGIPFTNPYTNSHCMQPKLVLPPLLDLRGQATRPAALEFQYISRWNWYKNAFAQVPFNAHTYWLTPFWTSCRISYYIHSYVGMYNHTHFVRFFKVDTPPFW